MISFPKDGLISPKGQRERKEEQANAEARPGQAPTVLSRKLTVNRIRRWHVTVAAFLGDKLLIIIANGSRRSPAFVMLLINLLKLNFNSRLFLSPLAGKRQAHAFCQRRRRL